MKKKSREIQLFHVEIVAQERIDENHLQEIIF